MIPAKRLRAKIDAREVTTGILVTHHLWPELVEVCQRAGLDYLIVDLEHGNAPAHLVAEVCATGRRLGFPVLIRPLANDYPSIRQAIDLGACGFLLACVESAADLDVVRDGIYIPPRGRRRPGGEALRWVPDHLGPTWQREVEANFIVLPQIETRKALANVAEIARHEVTTAVALGPYDLSAELGVCGRMDDPKLWEACAAVKAAAEAAGKTSWMIGGNGAALVKAGWHFICIGEPTWILEAALREKAEQARRAVS